MDQRSLNLFMHFWQLYLLRLVPHPHTGALLWMRLRRAQNLLMVAGIGLVMSCFAEPDVPALSVLEKNCLECHGGKATKSGLDLSTHEGLLKGGESGEPAVVAGKPDASLLFKKVSHTHEPVMPYKRDKLSDADIKILRDWIAAGATYSRSLDRSKFPKETFWSLKPLAPTEIPKTKNKLWAKTPIDSFILATLEGKNLKPSTTADKRTLLRRVTFDLTGLPPTPEEMSSFLKDKSPDAYAKVVDRLLASPRYGERWARHWLDTVHYADTHGHDQDRPRPNAWPYRDYVIRAFNEDKPYARFVQEQLAGDVLFPEDPNGVVATGFIVAGPWDLSSLMAIMEDTVDKKIARYLDRDDMIMTTMSTFVSTTVHCARCHNHKFDPILQTEYYNLQAVFAGVDRADRPYDLDPKTNAVRQAALRKKAAIEVKDKRFLESLLDPETQAKVAAWEKTVSNENIWTVLDPTIFTSSAGATLTKQNDFSILASGEAPAADTYTITANTDLKGITAIRLEVLTDSSHPRNGPGRQPENGNITLSEIQVTAAPRDNPSAAKKLTLQNPTADFNQTDWSVDKALDGKNDTGWAVFPETGKPHFAYFELKDDAGFTNGTTFVFTLEQQYGRYHTILRPRLSVTTARRPVRAESFPENVKKILATPAADRSKEQKIELAVFYTKQQMEKELAAMPTPKLVYAAANDFTPQMNFIPAKTPRPIHVLKRGEVTKPLDPAVPGALSCVSGLSSRFEVPDENDEGARRAALAKWITDPNNFLTWRSIVNRVWHYHFGRGIVETLNDFGQMGARPSHPELLDWLAVWFRDHGGSIKELHRLILMSAAYQQTALGEEKEQGRKGEKGMSASEIDADNHLLWRMNRTRLDAESVRDAVLQLSGNLDLNMGGPPVMQFTLIDTNGLNTPVVDYASFDVDNTNNFRRSIYRYLFRSLPDPFMEALDCPDGSQLTPVRNVSMTSLQALALWNDAFIVRQSEYLAVRVAKAGSLREQIEKVYELALNRAPTRRELKELESYAKQYGMANTCRVILNSNEFVFLN